MLAPRPGPMTFEEYLDWESKQEELWELVDGYPVPRSDRWDRDPVTGMAGTTRAHNIIVGNVLAALHRRLRGGPCRALASHMRHQSTTKGARYPDASVDCGSGRSDSLLALEPRVVIEVLSKSNTPGQQMLLIADYQAIPTLQHMIFIEQSRPVTILWTRNADGWRAEELNGLDQVMSLPAIHAELPLAEIFEDIAFSA